MSLNPKIKTHKWMLGHLAGFTEECVIWPFSIVRGYGHLKYRGKISRANRVMCIEAHGEPPTPKHQAAHECGNCACLNPRHLKWKTPSENQLDKAGHGAVSSKQGSWRLNPEAVAVIRRLKGKATHDVLAARFGVSRRTIGAVLSGQTWPSGDYSPKGFAVTGPWKKSAGQSAK
jgi:hypothetical protein